MTKWPGTWILWLFLALHKEELLKYFNLYLMEFVQINFKVRGKWSFLAVKALVWDPVWFSANVLALNLGHRDNVHEFWRTFENKTRSQNTAYTTRKSWISRVLCTLFERILLGINRDILKRSTLCGPKYNNKLRVPSRKHTYIIFDPLKPHFYIVKLGFTGVYIIFVISAQKHRLSVLVRTASTRRF